MLRREFISASLGAAAALPCGNVLARQLIALGQATGDLAARTLAGAEIALRKSDVDALAATLRGTVLVPGNTGYDDARRVWNGIFDRRPALIARCASPSDVIQAVNFAREHDLLTSVRCGGHSQTGKSVNDGGIVIDCSPMQAVRVDPVARTARVEGGALLAHLDRETRAFRLATTAGTVSHTGAAGLTLGGGFGRLGRRFGLACDNLIGADLVTADGRLLQVSEKDNRDLLWGLRGGGGNFGVATSLVYRLHPLDPTILGGNIIWPFEQAGNVMRRYADYTATAPDALNTDLFAVHLPNGQHVIVIECCWSGDLAKGEGVLRPLRQFGKPIVDEIAAIPYLKLQGSLDKVFDHGTRAYIKAGFVVELTDSIIDGIVAELRSAPPGTLGMFIQQSGGAVGRVAPDATAFPNRKGKYWLMVNSFWRNPADNGNERIARARAAFGKVVEPHVVGFYVNSMAEDDYAKVDENYGANYARLVRLKNKYDPKNLFRLNANVKPTAST